MTDWIEHDGGPQPVADDVWVEVEVEEALYGFDANTGPAGAFDWVDIERYHVLNQHLIDAARLEGIRLGLEAAKTHLTKGGWITGIGGLDPATIAKEADR